MSQRFRLKKQTIATVMQDGKRIAVRIPEGATVVAIDSVPANQSGADLQQVNVRWRGKGHMMFLVDLQEHGVPIQAAVEK
jgi:hypothetical protein